MDRPGLDRKAETDRKKYDRFVPKRKRRLKFKPIYGKSEEQRKRRFMENPSEFSGQQREGDFSPELPGKASPEYGPSVRDMGPAYPRYRDRVIKGIVIVVFVSVLGGGLYMFMGARLAIEGFRRDPARTLTRWVMGSGPYDTCESFVRQNPDLFDHLGKDLQLSLIREEVKLVNRERTAKITIRARGSEAREELFFFIQKEKAKWRVVSVAARTPKGGYRTLYPEAKSTSNKL
ncbi:MAG: hypothetical protein V1689_10965 [Pseudomonadota bacterium]